MLKIFHTKTCAKCVPVIEMGELLESKGYRVEYYDIEDVDGLTEATYYGVIQTPTVVVVDKEGDSIGSLRSPSITFEDMQKLADLGREYL